MDNLDLTKSGLTIGESKVYLALLRIGASTVGKIIKESTVSNSKIYDILDRLGKKGLVGIVLENGVKHFEAKDPKRLAENLELDEAELISRKKQVQFLIPQLEAIQLNRAPVHEAEILQGIKGIKTFTEMILTKLERGDTFYILGAPKESISSLGGYFEDWHVRRAEKGNKCQVLFNQETAERAKQRSKTPLTEVRFLPDHVKTPALIDIGKEYVATIVFGENPLCIVIRNQKVAQSYLEFFKLLWKQSK